MKPIDADVLVKRINSIMETYPNTTVEEIVDVIIHRTHALDVRPNIHAHWIEVDYTFPYKCSACGNHQDLMTNFCWNCGAIMDEGSPVNEEVINSVKETIKKYYKYADCGIFDCHNLVGDTMCTIYNKDGVQIDICYDCCYFEVFGLTDKEFKELEEYYDSLEED